MSEGTEPARGAAVSERSAIVARMEIEEPGRRRAATRRSSIVLLAAASLAIAAIGVIGQSGGGTAPPMNSPNPSPIARVGPPIGESVGGLNIQSVGQVLDRRRSGAIKGEPVALGGYWTDRTIGHSCAVVVPEPGVLELGCHDIEFGITERNEPILTFNPDQIRPAAGPYLNPYIPEALLQPLVSLPIVGGQRYPPVPIVVVGHFDDPRAIRCRPQFRQTCLDRFVVDRIVLFNRDGVAPPTATPRP